MLIQEAATHMQHVHDPFWLGIGIAVLGAAVLVERLIRGKP
ncbi:hypothetical protein LCGC14_2243800, partial [marine sediment metagenome]